MPQAEVFNAAVSFLATLDATFASSPRLAHAAARTLRHGSIPHPARKTGKESAPFHGAYDLCVSASLLAKKGARRDAETQSKPGLAGVRQWLDRCLEYRRPAL
jgi:hypothetical protein